MNSLDVYLRTKDVYVFWKWRISKMLNVILLKFNARNSNIIILSRLLYQYNNSKRGYVMFEWCYVGGINGTDSLFGKFDIRTYTQRRIYLFGLWIIISKTLLIVRYIVVILFVPLMRCTVGRCFFPTLLCMFVSWL